MTTLKSRLKKNKSFLQLREVWKFLTLRRTSYFKFLYAQRVSGFNPSEKPTFDSIETEDFFRNCLMKSKNYLEFGSGGSTFLAANLGISFISIDSDKYYLDAVKTLIQKKIGPLSSTQILIHRNIGPTKQWGRPLISFCLSKLFARYSDIPADPSLTRPYFPDLVLIDGRFRVACALKVLKHLRSTNGWTILFDDYTDRPHYHVIEGVSPVTSFVGRMAVFNSIYPGTERLLEELIKKYENNPD